MGKNGFQGRSSAMMQVHGFARRRVTAVAAILALLLIASTLLVSLNQTRAATAWAPNTAYATGALVSYGGHDYKCIQGHTSQVGWEPPNVPSLWQDLGVSTGATATNTTGPTA